MYLLQRLNFNFCMTVALFYWKISWRELLVALKKRFYSAIQKTEQWDRARQLLRIVMDKAVFVNADIAMRILYPIVFVYMDFDCIILAKMLILECWKSNSTSIFLGPLMVTLGLRFSIPGRKRCWQVAVWHGELVPVRQTHILRGWGYPRPSVKGLELWLLKAPARKIFQHILLIWASWRTGGRVQLMLRSLPMFSWAWEEK